MSDALTEFVDHFKAEINVVSAPSAWYTVTQEMITQFAELTHDEQFIHVDPERSAVESPYGTTIGHGFFTLSLLTMFMEEIAASAGSDVNQKADMYINYGLDRVRFPNPVRVNSKLRATRKLVSVEVKPPNAVESKYEVTVEIEGEEKPACVAVWVTRAYFTGPKNA